MESRKKFVQLCEVVVAAAFVAVLLVSILAAVSGGIDNIWQMAAALILGILLVVLVLKCNINYESKYALLFLVIVSMIIKGGTVILVRPTPGIDDLAMFGFAEEILSNGRITISSRYIAGFPHIMGYVSFVTIFFKLFGHVPVVAACVNACLSIFSMLVIYRIGHKVFENKKAAFWASFLWCICPSQTLWNCFVLSEAYYTTLLLVSIYVIMRALKEREGSIKKTACYGICIGVVVALFNMTRPVGIVFIIALALIIFCLENLRINKQMIVLLVSSIICFLLMQNVTNLYVRYMVGEEPAGLPWYNIAVGCNEEGAGKWNEEDWNSFIGFLNSEESAGIAQEKMQPIVIEHVKSIDNWGTFLLKKMQIFIGDDSSTLMAYLNKGGVDFKEYKDLLSKTCNIFFYMVELMALGSLFLFQKKKKNREMYLCLLVYIGSFLAYTIVEVQTRYHYPLTAIAIVLAGYLFGTLEKGTKTEEEK